jgi:shikimate dehydrogenase
VKLALIGDPVEHSRSPAIHERFLREAGIAGSYDAIRVRAGEGARAIARLRDEGYDGCNVTSPLKEEAFRACDHVATIARNARAANTIAFGVRTVGTTTDGTGAAQALSERMGSVRGREILVLGSGPTARAAVLALAEEGARLWIWARNEDEVRRLCETVGCVRYAGASIDDAIFSALVPEAEVPESVVVAARAVPLVMDANYGERSTLARRLGREVADGSRMLELQARASFEFWKERMRR